MIDPKSLLDRFLGPGSQGSQQIGKMLGQFGQGAGSQPPTGRASGGIPAGFIGGAASGGLVGLLLGGRKKKKGFGGILSHGGAAALGALAYRAWQNWQQGQAPATAPAASTQDVGNVGAAFQIPAQAAPFNLSLIRAMIGAAKADGHIDADEQRALFAQVEQMGLDAEAKAFVFDALSKPTDLDAIAAGATTREQAAELYMAARVVSDIDHPAERAYLDALAHKLALPQDLIGHLSAQGEAAQQGKALI